MYASRAARGIRQIRPIFRPRNSPLAVSRYTVSGETCRNSAACLTVKTSCVTLTRPRWPSHPR